MIFRAAVLAAFAWAVSGACLAQSGGARLHGWVAFENVAYVDTQPRATVRLRHDPPETSVVYTAKTDEHGFFDFPRISLGRFRLEISADGFQSYAADVYVPSDFAGNWAVQLKSVTPAAKTR
jgi:hypothetical protein